MASDDAGAGATPRRRTVRQAFVVTPARSGSTLLRYLLDSHPDVMLDPDDPRIDAVDDTVAVIKAYDVFQRMPNRAAFFNEVYRVLAHAGLILSQTPSTDGRGAFQDPSHTAFYNENSFMYLTQSSLHELIPDLAARFQVSHLRTFFPTELHVDAQISYVQANLLAVKDGPRQGGPLLC